MTTNNLRQWATPDLVSAWTQYRDLVSDPVEGTPDWLLAANREKRDTFSREIRRRKRAGAVPPGGLESSVPFDLAGEVKARIDLVDLIQESTTLRKNGREWRGTCPLHGGDNPTSLAVNLDKSVWHCFACQAGGDCFTWIEQRDGLNFVESLKVLARRAGLETRTKARKTLKTGPGEPENAPENTPDEGWTKHLADAIQETDHFAVDVGYELYRYRNGVYAGDGRRHVGRRCKQLLEASEQAQRWTTYRVGQVVEYIRVDAPALWDRPPLDVLNIKNGLLDLTSGELQPHTPEYLSTVQLPVVYDPEAECPAWHAFIRDVFPADSQGLPWELVAWLMTADTSIQKAVLLLGEGRNGKSTFLTALATFLGKKNVTGVSLHRLEANRFTTARLVGKLANICPDLPSEHLAGTSTFKALTGGDLIHAERKYGESFEFESFARLVFSANMPPQSADSSHAFFRRWLVVPFDRTFTDEDEVPREVLDRRLADPKELSGVLNMALVALPRVREHGITETESMRQAWHEFREVTDPVEVWLDLNTVVHPEAFAEKGDLVRAYNADAKANGRPAITPGSFGKAVKRWKPDITDSQLRIGERRPLVWQGIGLKAQGNDITW